MKKTNAGLPNTCWKCGADNLEYWFAENEDRALAGGGICEACAFPVKAEPEPVVEAAKPARRRKATT